MRNFKTILFITLWAILFSGWAISLLVSLQVQRSLFEDMGVQFHLHVKHAISEKMNMVAFHGPAWHLDSLHQAVVHGTTVQQALFVSPTGRVLNNPNHHREQTIPADTVKAWSNLGNTVQVQALDGGGSHSRMRIVSRMEAPASCGTCHQVPQLAYFVTDVSTPPHRTDPLRLHLMSLLALVAVVSGFLLFIRSVHLRKVQGRLELIREALERVEQGDYRSEVPEPSDLELKTLTQAINRMLVQLDQARAKLEEHHGRQLIRADQLASVGELAAGVAHEIKNPVAGILGAITVILKECPDKDPLRPVYEQILTQINRVNDAINDLLSYARPRPPQPVQFPVADLLQNVLPLIRKQASATGVVVVVSGDLDVPAIWADPLQMGQVLVNLLLNGIQAMPKGGTLHVRVSELPLARQVVIEVQDEGPGVAEDRREQIFRPFFTTKHRGTGLGLPISRRIVEAHGGDLLLVSRPGEGALFMLHLPIHAPEGGTKAEAIPEAT